MTGEHGDGIVRSVWIEKMFGRRLVDAFRRIKTAFDPQGILNPGKIVAPFPMTEHLRWTPRDEEGRADSLWDRIESDGVGLLQPWWMEGLAEMCSGVGQCRQKLVGTMCPSYMANE